MFVLKTTCECFSRTRRHYYSKLLHRNKAVSDGAISFYLDHFVRTRVSKVTYGSFFHPKYNPSDPDHKSQSHKVYTAISGEEHLRDFFYISLPKVSCLITFLESMLFRNFLFVEYPSFGDEGIQKIFFFPVFRFFGEFPSC